MRSIDGITSQMNAGAISLEEALFEMTTVLDSLGEGAPKKQASDGSLYDNGMADENQPHGEGVDDEQ